LNQGAYQSHFGRWNLHLWCRSELDGFILTLEQKLFNPMPSKSDYIIEKNREQKVSEEDTFTEDRYRQMAGHVRKSKGKIFDVGCGTGRGGRILKSIIPGVELLGLDCVPERVDALP